MTDKNDRNRRREFVRNLASRAQTILNRTGMYDPADEHASCGVGMIAAMSMALRPAGLWNLAIDALKKLWHRGAVDADGLKPATAPASMFKFPWEFVQRAHPLALATSPAMIQKLLSAWCSCRKPILGAQEVCRTIVETEVLRAGYQHLRLATGPGMRR